MKYRIYNCHGTYTANGIPAMIEHTKKCMQSAADLNMNVFIMAKDWPIQAGNLVTYKYFPPLAEYADMELANGYTEAYKQLSGYAKERGLGFYPSLTELYIPKEAYAKYPEWRSTRLESGRELSPDANPCFSHPYTREHFQAKVRELCETMPGVEGFEMWMGEKESSVLYCMCGKCKNIPSSERLLALIWWAYDTMKLYAPGKKLLVRSYLCAGRCFNEPEIFLPIADRMPKDIIFGLIGQYGDFDYLNDFNPMAGRFPMDTIVEFDLGGEYRGFYYGYFSGITDYFFERMEHYLNQGISGFAFRHEDWLGAVNYAQARAVAGFCSGAKKSGKEYEMEYLTGKFGGEAAGLLCELMRAGAEVCELDLHILGCNAFGCFGIFPETLQRLRYNLFDHSAQMRSGSLERLLACIDDPTEALEEKDRARQAADRFAGMVEKLRPLVPGEVYESLRISADIMTAIVEPHKLLTELLFAYMKYERAVLTRDRLRATYRVLDVTKRLRCWLSEKGGALKSADLPKWRALQGIYSEAQFFFNERNPHPDVDAIGVLCDWVENSFEKGWEYYNWNIVY